MTEQNAYHALRLPPHRLIGHSSESSFLRGRRFLQAFLGLAIRRDHFFAPLRFFVDLLQCLFSCLPGLDLLPQGSASFLFRQILYR